jgi:RNA recognition motif-containing protein
MAQDGHAGGAGAGEPLLPYYGEDDEPAPPSSRLCVKNIPKHLKDDRLREHFAARGEVTDCKVLKTRCVSRRDTNTPPNPTLSLFSLPLPSLFSLSLSMLHARQQTSHARD